MRTSDDSQDLPKRHAGLPQVHNVLGFTWGNALQAGTVIGDIHFTPSTDKDPDVPLYVSYNLLPDPSRVARIREENGAPSDRYLQVSDEPMEIVIEGFDEQVVILRGLRARVYGRHETRSADGPNWNILHSQPPVREFTVNLDEDPPVVCHDDETQVRWRRDRSHDGFPLTVTRADIEYFRVRPTTEKGEEIEWRLELDWTWKGRQGTLVIDDNGKPFRLYPFAPSGRIPMSDRFMRRIKRDQPTRLYRVMFWLRRELLNRTGE